MSLLFAEKRSITSVPWDQGGDLLGGMRSKAGETVNFSTVIGLDAVAAVVGLISDVVDMLPLKAYQDQNGIPTPIAAQMADEPSFVVDPRSWRVQMAVSWMLWGNAYGLVRARDRAMRPSAIDWLDPDSVTVDEPWGVFGPVTYSAGGRPINPDDIVHVPGRFMRPGYRKALVPLERFKETFGLAAAARNYGARWFGDGAHPSAVLSTDKPIDQEQAKTIKERFIAALRGRREPVVLGAGMTYTAIQTAPNESQFAETNAQSAVAVARALGLLQPEMIGAAVSGSTVTYANREQRAIDFLTFSADPYLVRIEDFVTRLLAGPDYAKFTRGALLRTDISTRYRAHDTAIRAGWRTPDEVRRLEDEAPLPEGGDNHIWPPYATYLPPET